MALEAMEVGTLDLWNKKNHQKFQVPKNGGFPEPEIAGYFGGVPEMFGEYCCSSVTTPSLWKISLKTSNKKIPPTKIGD